MTNKKLREKLELTDEEYTAYSKYTKADVYFAYVNEAKELARARLEIRRLNVVIAGYRHDTKKDEGEQHD